MIMTAHLNLLESAAVSLAAGTEDPARPLYRLYDRGCGRDFAPLAAETVEVVADQGAGEALAVDRIIIPAGHGLAGMTICVLCSGDGVNYVEATPAWVAGEGLITRSWEPVASRYWKFAVVNPATIPTFSELFLTATYAWARDPVRPGGAEEPVLNVERRATSGGAARFLVSGQSRIRRSYYVPRVGRGQRDEMAALYETVGAGKPFWLYDHEGKWVYGTLWDELNLRMVAHETWAYEFRFEEVIP